MSKGVEVHPTAIVEPGARLGARVKIGAYSIIRGDVEIGDDTSIGPHSVVESGTTMGTGNRVQGFASIGTPPQDLKYAGGPTRLVIGNDNTIREFSTLNRGTEAGGGVTRVGDSNMVMAYAHVAHDCWVGSSVVLANCATMAGHVTIEDYAIIGGLVGIHQFCRIGSSAMIGGASAVTLDVPPFCMAHGNHANLQGLNVIGLKRRGFGADDIGSLKTAYRVLFQSKLRLRDALDRLRRELADSPPVAEMVRFIESSERGICR